MNPAFILGPTGFALLVWGAVVLVLALLTYTGLSLLMERRRA